MNKINKFLNRENKKVMVYTYRYKIHGGYIFFLIKIVIIVVSVVATP